MLLPAVAFLYAASGSGVTPAASFTPEGFLLVYGPLGVLATMGADVLRRYIRSLVEGKRDAEARADRAEAELKALNAEVRHDVVPALTQVTVVMADVVGMLRARP